MSRKVIESKSTGIYRKIRYAPIPMKTKKGEPSIRAQKSLRKFFQQINESFDLQRLLDRLEAAGKKMIQSHGGKLELKERLPSGGMRWAKFWVPKDAPPIAHDASELLWEIVCLRNCIKENHAENAAIHAFRLGRIAERANVRPFEAAVKTGSNIRKGLQEGRETKRRQFEQEATKWQKEFNRIARENPRLKKTTICNRIAASSTDSGFRVSGRTVLARTKDPRKSS